MLSRRHRCGSGSARGKRGRVRSGAAGRCVYAPVGGAKDEQLLRHAAAKDARPAGAAGGLGGDCPVRHLADLGASEREGVFVGGCGGALRRRRCRSREWQRETAGGERAPPPWRRRRRTCGRHGRRRSRRLLDRRRMGGWGRSVPAAVTGRWSAKLLDDWAAAAVCVSRPGSSVSSCA